MVKPVITLDYPVNSQDMIEMWMGKHNSFRDPVVMLQKKRNDAMAGIDQHFPFDGFTCNGTSFNTNN